MILVKANHVICCTYHSLPTAHMLYRHYTTPYTTLTAGSGALAYSPSIQSPTLRPSGDDISARFSTIFFTMVDLQIGVK